MNRRRQEPPADIKPTLIVSDDHVKGRSRRGHHRDLTLVAIAAVAFLVGRYSVGQNDRSEHQLKSNLQQASSAGWKSIFVYFAEESDIIPAGPTWHSVHGQDKAVYELLNKAKGNGEGGFFLDLAANEAVYSSNTLALERDHEWNGLCIEPVSTYWIQLSHRKCTVIGAVVGKHHGEMIEFDENVVSGHQGIIGDAFRNKPSDKKRNPNDISYLNKKRRSSTLIDILQRYESQRQSIIYRLMWKEPRIMSWRTFLLINTSSWS